jgi:Ca2+-transporting ATPase
MLLGWPQLGVGLMQGLLLLAATLGIYALSLSSRVDVDVARTLAFIGLTAGNLALIRVVATRKSTVAGILAPDHGAYWGVAAIASLVTVACIVLPGLAHIFQFQAPPARLVLIAVAVGLVSALIFDLAKPFAAVQRILGRSAL